ncbi:MULTISPECIES: LexA family protein [unclassified Shewanella]|uniref:LexA family protein n=1 Tax=Shewanella TaxID=22 RepID=UPI0021D8E32F|nr:MULTISPECIES: LexA family transcriptional regulator [unclassified Shewanella]MCU8044390.1 LexA family transcriptional regulator [Shewanella sp. SM68]MCU8048472.1 LexA family transcriptional regulator [Shewanella sp. SM65]
MEYKTANSYYIMDILQSITIGNNCSMKISWIDLVKTRMKEAGVTQSMLAEKMGMSQGAIAHWLGGNRKPSIEDIASMMSIVGISHMTLGADGLIDYPDSVLGNTKEVPAKISYVKSYPVISYVQAGAWTEAVESCPASDEWYETTERTSENCFWLRVSGDSMTSPSGVSFPEGTLILVDTERDHQNGSFVVAKLTDVNEATFKKLVIDAGQKFLKPLNSSYPTLPINGNCKIIGVVVDAKIKIF